MTDVPSGVEAEASGSPLAWDGWPFAAAVALGTTAVCLVATFFLPEMLGLNQWLLLGDARWTIQSTQFVTWGGLAYVYSANIQFLPLPGFLLVLAPAVAIGDHLGLINAYPFPIAHPSMLLAVAPVFAATGSTAVLGADYLAASLGISRFRRRILAPTIGLIVVLPTVCWAGHPEDLLCLALSCLSLGLLVRGRHRPAATILSIAVMMQPWALVLIPLVLVATPPGARIRACLHSCALPAITGLTLLCLDFKDAFRSLVIQPMQGYGQHLPWWAMSHTMTLIQSNAPVLVRVGSGPRFVAVAIAVAGAWWIRNDLTPANIMLVASVDLAARGIFETQVWCYYLGPAAVLMALHAAAHAPTRRRWLAGSLSAFAYYAYAAAGYNAYSMPAMLALAIMCATTLIVVLSATDRPVLPQWGSRRAAPAVAAQPGLVGLGQPARRSFTREGRRPLTP